MINLQEKGYSLAQLLFTEVKEELPKPKLKGSDAQVRWANILRGIFSDMYRKGDINGDKDTILKGLSKVNDAVWWIEKNDSLTKDKNPSEVVKELHKLVNGDK